MQHLFQSLLPKQKDDALRFLEFLQQEQAKKPLREDG